MKEILAERVEFYPGDCLEVLPTLAADSIDSCVTDPPYGLEFMGKRWDAPWQSGFTESQAGRYPDAMARERRNPTCENCRRAARWRAKCVCASPSFDHSAQQTAQHEKAQGFQNWCRGWAHEVFRVLKPGGHLLAFSGTRTYHRMACAIEDAGFEIRDQIGWAYGSGFPKSHNQKGDWEGWGTALKPAWEPIVLARKPLIGTVAANVAEHGTGALNINGCRVATDENLNGGAYTGSERHDGTENWRFKNGGARQPMPGDEREGAALGMFQPGKTVGTAYEQPPGRWPANIVHDGSEEVVGAFPETVSGAGNKNGGNREHAIFSGGPLGQGNGDGIGGDAGSAARFFYTAKADADDRLGSRHPTVKPIDLMQWLVRLVTPPGGTVLDPFAGTGTTGEAAWREGFRSILIEREPEYQNDIRRRMSLVLGGPDERKRAAIKERTKDLPADHGPLFSEIWDKPFYPTNAAE